MIEQNKMRQIPREKVIQIQTLKVVHTNLNTKTEVILSQEEEKEAEIPVIRVILHIIILKKAKGVIKNQEAEADIVIRIGEIDVNSPTESDINAADLVLESIKVREIEILERKETKEEKDQIEAIQAILNPKILNLLLKEKIIEKKDVEKEADLTLLLE